MLLTSASAQGGFTPNKKPRYSKKNNNNNNNKGEVFNVEASNIEKNSSKDTLVVLDSNENSSSKRNNIKIRENPIIRPASSPSFITSSPQRNVSFADKKLKKVQSLYTINPHYIDNLEKTALNSFRQNGGSTTVYSELYSENGRYIQGFSSNIQNEQPLSKKSTLLSSKSKLGNNVLSLLDSEDILRIRNMNSSSLQSSFASSRGYGVSGSSSESSSSSSATLNRATTLLTKMADKQILQNKVLSDSITMLSSTMVYNNHLSKLSNTLDLERIKREKKNDSSNQSSGILSHKEFNGDSIVKNFLPLTKYSYSQKEINAFQRASLLLFTNFNISTQVRIVPLLVTTLGTANYQVIGNSFRIRCVDLSFKIIPKMTYDQPSQQIVINSFPVIYRIALVFDYQPNISQQATPQYIQFSDIFQDNVTTDVPDDPVNVVSSSLSGPNLDNEKRFQILLDEQISVPSGNFQSPTPLSSNSSFSNLVGNQRIDFDQINRQNSISKRYKKMITQFDASQSIVNQSTITSGQLYLVVVPLDYTAIPNDLVLPLPSVYYNIRVHYQ